MRMFLAITIEGLKWNGLLFSAHYSSLSSLAKFCVFIKTKWRHRKWTASIRAPNEEQLKNSNRTEVRIFYQPTRLKVVLYDLSFVQKYFLQVFHILCHLLSLFTLFFPSTWKFKDIQITLKCCRIRMYLTWQSLNLYLIVVIIISQIHSSVWYYFSILIWQIPFDFTHLSPVVDDSSWLFNRPRYFTVWCCAPRLQISTLYKKKN